MSGGTDRLEPLLTPAEVASRARVTPQTVARWADAGKLSSVRTLGGHRRYREPEVRAFLLSRIRTKEKLNKSDTP